MNPAIKLMKLFLEHANFNSPETRSNIAEMSHIRLNQQPSIQDFEHIFCRLYKFSLIKLFLYGTNP